MIILDFIRNLRIDHNYCIIKHEYCDWDKYLTVRNYATNVEYTYSISEIRSKSWEDLINRLC